MAIFSGDFCGSVSNDKLIAVFEKNIRAKEVELSRQLTGDEKFDLVMTLFLNLLK